VSAKRSGRLVVLDSFYPGWQARVDGKLTGIDRTNYLFRSIELAGGEHQVVFSFRPTSFLAGMFVSLFCCLVVMAWLGWRLAALPGN
jgi:uncharacterized membrane protein YfhO